MGVYVSQNPDGSHALFVNRQHEGQLYLEEGDARLDAIRQAAVQRETAPRTARQKLERLGLTVDELKELVGSTRP